MFGRKWPYPCREATTAGTRTYTIYSKTATHAHKVDVVCKMWHEEFQKHVQLQVCWVSGQIHESAVKRALEMCKVEYYENYWEFPGVPAVSTSRSYLYVDEEQVFSLTFTRRRVAKADGRHELVAEYGGPEKAGRAWPVHVMELPAACWIQRSVLRDDERAELEAWRCGQVVALGEWLAEQQARL